MECPACHMHEVEDVVLCVICGSYLCDRCGSLPEAICKACGLKMSQEEPQ